MHEPSVAAGLMQALFDFAVIKGADPAALAGASGFGPDEQAAADDRVAYDKYVLLTRAAKRLSGDDALALHFGEEVEMSAFSVVGLLGPPPGSAREVIDYFNRYIRLLIEVPGQPPKRLELARRGPGLWLVDTRPRPNDFPELTESMFARMVAAARRMGIREPIERLDVTHPKPAYHGEYDRLFRVPVRFESGWNAVQLGDELVRLLPEGVQPTYAHRLAVAHAETLLNELDDRRSWKGRVAEAIAASLGSGGTTVEGIARAFGLSRQTLYRRLKLEGVTFEDLIDEVRAGLARSQLELGKSVADVAHQLGYSDRAAFSKAFKRWTGTTPSKCRSR